MESVKSMNEIEKLENAIRFFKEKIEKQGRIINARDADHLRNLIDIKKQIEG